MEPKKGKDLVPSLGVHDGAFSSLIAHSQEKFKLLFVVSHGTSKDIMLASVTSLE